jgi:hypothetical protein
VDCCSDPLRAWRLGEKLFSWRLGLRSGILGLSQRRKERKGEKTGSLINAGSAPGTSAISAPSASISGPGFISIVNANVR